MQLGVVVINDRYAEHAMGLLKAAQQRGWDTRCFLTDRGVFLLKDAAFNALLGEKKTHVSLCEHSIDRYTDQGLSLDMVNPQIVIGGQYQNAELVHNCDQVLVF